MFIPILITPFDKNLKPDISSLVSLINHLTLPESRGFWLFGTGGEDFSLNFENRVFLLEQLSKVNSLDISKLYVGFGHSTFEDSIRICRAAIELGFSKFHFLQPSRAKSVESTFVQLKELKTYFGEPSLCLFCDNYSRALSYDDLLNVSKHGLLDYIDGIKYSTSDLDSLGKGGSCILV